MWPQGLYHRMEIFRVYGCLRLFVAVQRLACRGYGLRGWRFRASWCFCYTCVCVRVRTAA